MAKANGRVTRGDRRLLEVAHDDGLPAGDRAVALTKYAKGKRTLPRNLAALRRRLIVELAAEIGQGGVVGVAELLDVDHARISRLIAQERRLSNVAS